MNFGHYWGDLSLDSTTCTFDKFYMAVSKQVTEIVYLDIDMS